MHSNKKKRPATAGRLLALFLHVAGELKFCPRSRRLCKSFRRESGYARYAAEASLRLQYISLADRWQEFIDSFGVVRV